MPEYIEREAALKRIKELQKTNPNTVGKKQFADGYFCGLDESEIILNQISAADVVEVRQGKWIKKPHVSKEYKQCNVCKYDFSRLIPDNYCPNCGARMDGDTE